MRTTVPPLESVLWYENMAEVYKGRKTATKWEDDALIMRLQYMGVTDIETCNCCRKKVCRSDSVSRNN